ncbi:methyltransferase [Mycobacterium sp. ITM-2016-00318]|uniref:methyltransferase n=1 Tax=Mycobacterium sp. ITM-2016-00318 TaxID=2099693 RepID=UPI000CFA37EB
MCKAWGTGGELSYSRAVNASRIPPAKLVRVIERVRHVLGMAHQRSAPPAGAMMEMILWAWRVQGISVAAELKVADALSDGPLTADDLARRVGADPDALARLMRALISEGIFKRRRDGRFALNALGETLRSDAPMSMAGMARMVGHPSYREHWSGLVDAARTGEAYPPKLRGMGSWEWLETQPEFAAVFNDAMTSVSDFAVAPVVAAYDFSPFSTIVDVGGGHGRLLSAIVAATPGARGVLYDLPAVVEGAPAFLTKYGVAERVQVIGGSFFDAAPCGGDAYVMKNVIHDWPDAEALTILKNVRKAAKPGSTLLLVEFVIPDHDRGFIGKWADMEMLVQVAARERTADEYRNLHEQASFQMTRVVPTAGPISLVEGRAV